MSETTKAVPDVATRAVIVTALLVAAFALARFVVGAIVSAITTFVYQGGGVYNYAGDIGWQLFTVMVPLAAGVFIGFRIVARVTADLTVVRVLVRSLVASAIAAALGFVVGLFVTLGTSVTDNIFGNYFPLGQVGGAFAQAVSNFASTFSTFVDVVPLVGLAAVLLWLWLRRHGVTQGGLPTKTP
jgi:ABC-type multidrug transport system fused ATPase/permease subunit